MLAQNFMTAEALGLSDEQLSALVKTLGFFERGEVPAKDFYMGVWWEERADEDCGTFGCIGGWTQQLTGVSFHPSDMYRPAGLDELFYPPSVTNPAWEASVPQATQAIRNYLTTGDADWGGVMRG